MEAFQSCIAYVFDFNYASTSEIYIYISLCFYSDRLVICYLKGSDSWLQADLFDIGDRVVEVSFDLLLFTSERELFPGPSASLSFSQARTRC